MTAKAQAGLVPGSFRELWTVAVPLILSCGTLSLMQVVDRIFLTWYSTEALAASLPAALMHWLVMGIGFGTANYINAFVAQYEGAQQPNRVSASVWQGAYFSLLAGVFALAFIPLAGPIFAFIGHDPSIRGLEADYFALMSLGAGPTMLATTFSCFFSGRGQTMIVFRVNAVATLVNAVLDYAMIFGVAGFPEMGIRGAALATVLANVFAAAAFLWLFWNDADRVRYEVRHTWKFEGELFRRILRYGVPNGMSVFLDIVCFTLFLLLVGHLGKEELAATNLAFNLNTLAFVPMLGLGTAVVTLVGNRIGQGRVDLAARTTWIAFGLATAYILAFCAIYVLVPGLILDPYFRTRSAPEDDRLRELAIVLLRFVAVYSIFDAMYVVFGSAVRGAGDTRFAVVFSVIGGLLVMVVPTYGILHYTDFGVLGAWTAVTAFVIVLGVGFLLRFLAGNWRSMRIIELSASTRAETQVSSATEPSLPLVASS